MSVRRELRTIGTRLDSAGARLKQTHPGARLLQQAQRLDDLEQRMVGAMRGSLQDNRSRVSEALSSLLHHSPERRVRELRMKYDTLIGRMRHAVSATVSRADGRLTLAARMLDTVSPLATLGRGFAVVTRAADGALITDVASVQTGDEIEARLARGRLRARISGKED